MTPHRRIPEELPQPLLDALAADAAELRALGRRRLALLRRDAGGEAVVAVARTGSRTDTGSWFGKRRVCLAFTRTAMLLFATGPQPLCRRIPLTELKKTQYNTVTGELVFAPAELPVPTVALPPVEAARALAQIGKG